MELVRLGIVRLYCGRSGKKGFYNSQEIGLAKAMVKLNYKCYIFYPDMRSNTISEEYIDEDIVIINIPVKCIGDHSRFNWSMLQKYDIDVVEVESDNQIFAPSLIHYCDKHMIPVFSYIGTNESYGAKGLKKIVMDLLFTRNINAYKKHFNVAKTRTVYDKLKKEGISNIQIGHVGLDFSLLNKDYRYSDVNGLKKKYGFSENDKIVAVIGRIDECRNPLDAISVFNRFKKIDKNYKLLVIGKGGLEEQFFKNINDLGLRDHCIHISQLPNSVMWEVYRITDHLISFSRTEIFGMTLLEGMFYEKTVLAIHAPGPNEIITDKFNGYLFDTVDEMIESLPTVIINPTGQNAHDTVVNDFSWDKTAMMFDRLINEISLG